MIVLDASAVVDFLLDVTPHADHVGGHLRDHAGDLHAPHLLDAEVGSVLRRHVLRGELQSGRAHEAIEFLARLRITRYAHLLFLPRAMHLLRNITVYDALYITLAEALMAPLLTRDARLARSARPLIDVIHIR